jgi:hypothetical protein
MQDVDAHHRKGKKSLGGTSSAPAKASTDASSFTQGSQHNNQDGSPDQEPVSVMGDDREASSSFDATEESHIASQREEKVQPGVSAELECQLAGDWHF